MISKIEFKDLDVDKISRLSSLIDNDSTIKKNVDMMVKESWDMKSISGAIVISCRSDYSEINYYCWSKITELFKDFINP